MTGERPRILIVDDEEAILETMTFTFEDDYDVLTSTSATDALALLGREGPVAVVISDQRMPEMTGVEFLSRIFELYPHTVRIILTGFADMDAIIGSINDGHVYAYITKPWEPEHLKQVVRRAVDHYQLAIENDRLLSELRDSTVFLQAVVDELDTGALAVDANGLVRAANALAQRYLGMRKDPRGKELREVLSPEVLDRVGGAALRISTDDSVNSQEVELPACDGVRLRISLRTLRTQDGRELGRVFLAREISHEPLRRRFEEILEGILASGSSLRGALSEAEPRLQEIAAEVRASRLATPGMSELSDRISRTLTAIDYWQAVDDSLVREQYPDAQPLLERMRIATARWPLPDRIPERVRALANRVETYYESGENPQQPVL